MKRYMIFAYASYDQFGGLSSLVGASDTLEEAEVYITASAKKNDYDCADVYDTQEGNQPLSWCSCDGFDYDVIDLTEDWEGF